MLIKLPDTKDDSRTEQLYKSVGQRIRETRERAGKTVAALAQELDVTPGYIYLMETGRRVPREDKARKLARILNDDAEDLYIAWARAARAKPSTHQRTADELEDRLREYGVDVGVMTGDDIHFVRDRRGSRQSGLEPATSLEAPSSEAIEVPILPEGHFPDDQASIVDSYVQIPSDAIPPEEPVSSPFAYRVTTDSARRVRRVLRPGDTVVVSREAGPPVRNEIYAVRLGEKIVLSRVLAKPRVLILLSDEGEEHIDGIPVEGPAELRYILIGHVVLVIRQQVLRP